ncbi:MAG: MBL fold metallo-hydrolase [Dolichospermum sp.]
MKRRQLIGYTGAGLITAVMTNLGWLFPVNARSSDVSINWLGHTCFLFTTGNVKILINPFRTLGCTAKYRPTRVATDLVLISSQLLDEGYVKELPGNPKLVYQPGVYEFKGINFQGITTYHDRHNGKRFGKNIAWKLTIAGLNLLHLGGAAAPLTLEQKILMGRPDVLFIPVGGSAKAYNAQEAKAAITVLNPKLVIPTHYRTPAADTSQCDIDAVDDFLTVMRDVNIREIDSDSVVINAKSLRENTEIRVLSYKF